MKSYSAYFVRAERAGQAQRVFGKVEPMADSPWLLCEYRKDDMPPGDDALEGRTSLTEARSQQLGEILFVYGDTSADWFVYEHARDGVLLRKLVWFSLLDDWTAGWVCAEGEPEPWEAALFSPDKLAGFIENERQRYDDEGNADDFPEREAEIRKVWEAGQIIAGNTYPACDGTVALLVEQSYGIKRAI